MANIEVGPDQVVIKAAEYRRLLGFELRANLTDEEKIIISRIPRSYPGDNNVETLCNILRRIGSANDKR